MIDEDIIIDDTKIIKSVNAKIYLYLEILAIDIAVVFI
jgi:hypothetical protein